jgi:hypothetical protein
MSGCGRRRAPEVAVPLGRGHDCLVPGLAALSDLASDLVVDGEVACCDEAGTARFEWLGGWRRGRGDGTVRATRGLMLSALDFQ